MQNHRSISRMVELLERARDMLDIVKTLTREKQSVTLLEIANVLNDALVDFIANYANAGLITNIGMLIEDFEIFARSIMQEYLDEETFYYNYDYLCISIKKYINYCIRGHCDCNCYCD